MCKQSINIDYSKVAAVGLAIVCWGIVIGLGVIVLAILGLTTSKIVL